MESETLNTVATTSVRIQGSVHDSGEAYLNVERLHTPDGEEDIPIQVVGSTRKSSYEEISVESTVETLPADIPEPAESANGFTDVLGDDIRVEGEEFNIDRLYVSKSSDAKVLKALGEHFKLVQGLKISGAVHSPGAVTVNIEDLYVVEDDG